MMVYYRKVFICRNGRMDYRGLLRAIHFEKGYGCLAIGKLLKSEVKNGACLMLERIDILVSEAK